MQDNVNISTNEKDLNVKYGLYNLGPEREAARGSLKYILTDMNDIRKSFIRLGFHLHEMLCNKYYEDFGFSTIEEFAEANLGMDKSNVYRYIRVFEQFGAPVESSVSNGLSSISPRFALGDKWKDYSFSQLVEMCSMSDDQRRACKSDMTIKQIREIKKTVPKDAHPVFDSSKELSAMVKDQQDQTEKVAMSPQKDKSKNYSATYCSCLYGAARTAYIKSRKAIGSVSVTIYDSAGNLLNVDPLVTNHMMDLIYDKCGDYVFRLREQLNCSMAEQGRYQSWSSQADQPEVPASQGQSSLEQLDKSGTAKRVSQDPQLAKVKPGAVGQVSQDPQLAKVKPGAAGQVSQDPQLAKVKPRAAGQVSQDPQLAKVKPGAAGQVSQDPQLAKVKPGAVGQVSQDPQ